LPEKSDLDGAILALEVAGTPPHFHITNFLTGLGERKMLQKFSAIIIGLPQATASWKESSKKKRREYRKYQKIRIKQKVKEYTRDTPILFNFNFGHITPNIPLPIGGEVRLDPETESISLKF